MDNVKVLNISKAILRKSKKLSKKDPEKCSLISHEDVFKSIRRYNRERNKRYRSWLGWFWKSHDWCYWRFWGVLRCHPIKETKWFFQRAVRGWSDCDAWGAYNYLAKVISEMTAYLAHKPSGFPGNLKDGKEWEIILKKISKAFKLMNAKDRYNADLWKRAPTLAKKCDMQNKKEYVQVEEGWHLFREWFYSLWD